MRDMLFVLSQVNNALVAGTKSLNHAAIALVKTADDFVETDGTARRQYVRLTKALKDPGSNLGLDTGATGDTSYIADQRRSALKQKDPDQGIVWDRTGDRSALGGDDTYYDDNGRAFDRHQDTTPEPTETPAGDREDRDTDLESELDDITEDL